MERDFEFKLHVAQHGDDLIITHPDFPPIMVRQTPEGPDVSFIECHSRSQNS